MKALKIAGIVLLALVLVLGIAIAFQPSHAHIEKNIVINAPASAIFPHVSNFRNFNKWSPWDKMDPEVKHTYEGGDATVGARMNWDGPKTGSGSQWTEEIEENKRIKNGMSFGDYGGKYYSEFILEPQGDATRVTWTYDGPNEGVGGKAMWIVMGMMLNSQYEQGLNDLKQVVESSPTP